MSETDVRTRKARFLWLKQELGMTAKEIGELLGKSRSAVLAWAADCRPDAAPKKADLDILQGEVLKRAQADIVTAQEAALAAKRNLAVLQQEFGNAA
jgi:hypothetical protein